MLIDAFTAVVSPAIFGIILCHGVVAGQTFCHAPSEPSHVTVQRQKQSSSRQKIAYSRNAHVNVITLPVGGYCPFMRSHQEKTIAPPGYRRQSVASMRINKACRRESQHESVPAIGRFTDGDRSCQRQNGSTFTTSLHYVIAYRTTTAQLSFKHTVADEAQCQPNVIAQSVRQHRGRFRVRRPPHPKADTFRHDKGVVMLAKASLAASF